MSKLSFVIGLIFVATCVGCDSKTKPDKGQVVPIGEGVFVYKEKVYKLSNNELLQLADLNDVSIRKLEISKPRLKDLGQSSLEFLKKGATANITGVYRGNRLYFKLQLNGINELREDYLPGEFTIEFLDELDFMIYSISIPISEIVRTVGEDGATAYFSYNGNIELSTDAESAISKFGITSSVRPK